MTLRPEVKLARTLALGAALLALGAGGSRAEEPSFPADPPYKCTLENVAGVYGSNEDTLRSPLPQQTVAGIAITDLRPDGTAATQLRLFLERGGPPFIDQVRHGRWTVEENCFGTIDIEQIVDPSGQVLVELDYLFVAVGNATEIFFVANNPLEEGDAKLLFRR